MSNITSDIVKLQFNKSFNHAVGAGQIDTNIIEILGRVKLYEMLIVVTAVTTGSSGFNYIHGVRNNAVAAGANSTLAPSGMESFADGVGNTGLTVGCIMGTSGSSTFLAQTSAMLCGAYNNAYGVSPAVPSSQGSTGGFGYSWLSQLPAGQTFVTLSTTNVLTTALNVVTTVYVQYTSINGGSVIAA